jgi:hypothetical protein
MLVFPNEANHLRTNPPTSLENIDEKSVRLETAARGANSACLVLTHTTGREPPGRSRSVP